MKVTRRTIVKAAVALPVVSVAGVGSYAFGLEPHWLAFPERPLPVHDLPRGLEGATLAQVSDLHVGPLVEEDYLLSALKRLSAMRPDIVVMTGDFVTYTGKADLDQLERLAPFLPRGRLATVASLGNHDYGHGWHDEGVAAAVAAILEKEGVAVLVNQVHRAGGLDIVGMGELWAGRFDPRSALTRAHERPTIVLSHNPDTLDRAGWGGYTGWVLSGHTHGGQVNPPFLPPPILPVQNKRYTAGAIALEDGRAVYISTGVGYVRRVRFGARPEIPVFRLERAGDRRAATYV